MWGRGFGRGFGRGWGMGRGFGFGARMGFCPWTGLPRGWRWGYGAGYMGYSSGGYGNVYGYRAPATYFYTPFSYTPIQTDKESLQKEAEYLKNRLNEIQKMIEELEGKE